jgi:regulator of RNase E activity RraA
MPPSIDAQRLEQLRQVETATVGHYRMHGFMEPRLLANQRGVRVAGTAVTVQTRGIDSTPIAIALDAIRPGDFLVIDRCGEHRHAALGAVVCKALQNAGAVGVVIDGRACDLVDIERQAMPLWCLGPSPILGRRLSQEGAVNIPISCGGVTVHPGDAVLADDSGLLVLHPDEIEAVTAEGLLRQEREVKVLARMAAGERLTDIASMPRFSDFLPPR